LDNEFYKMAYFDSTKYDIPTPCVSHISPDASGAPLLRQKSECVRAFDAPASRIMATVPWVEKYRPKDFDHIVLDPINQKLFRNILDKKYFPNLLFYGPPGTGKTTTIINLINEYQQRHYKTINKNLVIHLNASDERGIDIIRNHIYQFIKTKNMFDIGMKFVILDEVDYMTKNAQQALKYLLQTCNQNVRFCLICNYISKIEESLQNEFICIRFNQLPKSDILQFIKRISDNEGLKLSDESIDTIQNMFSSDIRSMINFIQLNMMDTSGGSPNVDPETYWDKKIINKQKMAELHQLLLDGMRQNENARTRETDEQILQTKQKIRDNIHNISLQYNIDKKSILLKYIHYFIQNAICLRSSASPSPINPHKPGCGKTESGRKGSEMRSIGAPTQSREQNQKTEDEKFGDILDIFGDILHNIDVKTDTLLDFFICGLIRSFSS